MPPERKVEDETGPVQMWIKEGPSYLGVRDGNVFSLVLKDGRRISQETAEGDTEVLCWVAPFTPRKEVPTV